MAANTRSGLEPELALAIDPLVPTAPLIESLRALNINYGVARHRLWRFVDLGRRLDFLVAGFGWCRMPLHLIAEAMATGRLASIQIADDPTPAEGLAIYAAHLGERELGRAGRWLLADLRARLAGVLTD